MILRKFENIDNYTLKDLEVILNKEFKAQIRKSLTGKIYLFVKNSGIRHLILENSKKKTIKTYPPFWWHSFSLIFASLVVFLTIKLDFQTSFSIMILVISFIITIISYPIFFAKNLKKFENFLKQIPEQND